MVIHSYRPDGYSFTENSTTYSANWAFDTAGRPSALTDGTDTFTYGYTYTAAGGLHTGTPMSTPSAIPFTLDGPQVDVTLAYDATRDTLVSRSNSTSTSNPLSKFTYTVNAIGQREGVATTGAAFGTTPSNSDRTWQFDPLGQVLSSDSTGTPNDRAYTYDSIGNRKAAQADATTIPSSPTAATTAYTANGANQYSSITVGTGGAMNPAPVNDADGNMTTGPVPGVAGLTPGVPAPSSATLKWDAENRLVEASVGEITLSYDYDYLGRLISRDDETTRTFYLYDGWNRIAEHSQTGSATPALSKVNLWGLDLSGTPQGAGGGGGLLSILDKPTGSRYYPAYDGNGNVSEYYEYTLDSDPNTAGNQTVSEVAAHFEYDPFGNLTVGTAATAAAFPFRFSTKPQDPVTGLYYYGYRWYDPLTGRWPSRDPIEEDGGVNLYGFVGNDGIGRREYLGLVAADPKAMIDTVHQGSIEAHKASEVEYLAQIKKENPNVTTLGNPPVNGGRPYKPKMPREYGGRVCEKCTKDDNGTLVYSYYLTQKFGPWPHTTFKAEIYLGDSPGCVDDKQVAWWHTHPSSLGRDKVGNGRTVKYRYYWNGDSGFSGADKGLVTNPMQNKDALPVFVTYRHLISEHEWDYYTDMYPPGMTVKKTSMKPEWVDLGDIEP